MNLNYSMIGEVSSFSHIEFKVDTNGMSTRALDKLEQMNAVQNQGLIQDVEGNWFFIDCEYLRESFDKDSSFVKVWKEIMKSCTVLPVVWIEDEWLAKFSEETLNKVLYDINFDIENNHIQFIFDNDADRYREAEISVKVLG